MNLNSLKGAGHSAAYTVAETISLASEIQRFSPEYNGGLEQMIWLQKRSFCRKLRLSITTALFHMSCLVNNP